MVEFRYLILKSHTIVTATHHNLASQTQITVTRNIHKALSEPLYFFSYRDV